MTYFVCRGVNKLDKETLHPTVIQFKGFINRHPELLKQIRKSGSSWQEYYEKWVLLGEEDPFWKEYKSISNEEHNNNHQINFITELTKLKDSMDINKIQQQVAQLSDVVSFVQHLLKEYNDKTNKDAPSARHRKVTRLFHD